MKRRFLILGALALLAANPLSAQERVERRDGAGSVVPEGSAVVLRSSPVEIRDAGIMNKASLPVAAVSGTFVYTLPNGQERTVKWTQNYSAPFFLPGTGLPPGTYRGFPPTADGNGGTIAYQEIRVDAAILEDGSIWGSRGAELKASCADRARMTRYHLKQMQEICTNSDGQSNLSCYQDSLSEQSTLFPGPEGSSLRRHLTKALLDEQDGTFIKDPDETVQYLLAHLSRF